MDTLTFTLWYKSTPTFEYYNANPTSKNRKGWGWDKPDCVIRALSKASGKDWIEAYDYLSQRARLEYTIPNDSKASRKWLVESGAIWTPCKAEKGKKRLTAREFAESHPEGSYILHIANHAAACVDGKIYDTWNCGCKALVGYHDMTNFSM